MHVIYCGSRGYGISDKEWIVSGAERVGPKPERAALLLTAITTQGHVEAAAPV